MKKVVWIALVLVLLSSRCLAAPDSQVSINAKETETKVVLASIATLANVNILIDESVRGTLTIKLDKVQFIEALELITKSKGLAYQQIGNTYIVATPDTLSKNYSKISVVPILHVNALDLKEALSSIVPAKSFSVDPLTNSIIFSGNTQQEQALQQAIGMLDKKVKQITLEAKVVSLNKEDSEAFGVNWQWSQIPAQCKSENNSSEKPTEDTLGGVIRFGRNYEFRFAATLDALVSKGKANILATPKLTTLPGKEATIFIGDNIPVITEKIENGTTTQSTTFVDAGIKLKYIAQITADNTVNAVVHTEVSTPTLVSELKNYKISTRQANTNVRLKNGETLVIGGLIGEEEIKNISKIPLLGDLPILGNLFKHTAMRKSKTEVIIFLTPHIID